MFDWLFGKAPPPDPPSVDRVWVDLAARDAAIVREAGKGPVVIYAFFEATLERVRQALLAAGRTPGADLVLVRADRPARGPEGAAILVAERHPLPVANRNLLARLAGDHPGVVPVFFTALDDGLMQRFSGDRTANLMRQLGLSADEPVEHTFVSKALANAREKVAQKAGPAAELDLTAPSMEAWLDRHIGPGAAR